MTAVRPYGGIEPRYFDINMNAGLWYDKYCDRWGMDDEKEGRKRWTLESFKETIGDNDKTVSPKEKWIKTVVGKSLGDDQIISEMYERRCQMLKRYDRQPLLVRNCSRFITGLGRSHPVENGFAWHHTLGVPYLPGSSVKGLIRCWATEWANWDENTNKDGTITRIFGPKPESGEESIGSIQFLDALPAIQPLLVMDIMTPHYAPYYQEKVADEGTPPADWYDPKPIPFLVVESGNEFHFGILPRNESNGALKDVLLVEEWLRDALTTIGAGAKTAVGYGRFEQIENPSDAD